MPRHLDDLIAATRVDVARIFLAIGLEQRLAHRLGRRRRLGVRVRGAPVLERRGDPAAETTRRPAEVRFQNLPDVHAARHAQRVRSEEHTSELQSLMRISYAVFCLKKKTKKKHKQIR